MRFDCMCFVLKYFQAWQSSRDIRDRDDLLPAKSLLVETVYVSYRLTWRTMYIADIIICFHTCCLGVPLFFCVQGGNGNF